jgi:hypothetical protein
MQARAHSLHSSVPRERDAPFCSCLRKEEPPIAFKGKVKSVTGHTGLLRICPSGLQESGQKKGVKSLWLQLRVQHSLFSQSTITTFSVTEDLYSSVSRMKYIPLGR